MAKEEKELLIDIKSTVDLIAQKNLKGYEVDENGVLIKKKEKKEVEKSPTLDFSLRFKTLDEKKTMEKFAEKYCNMVHGRTSCNEYIRKLVTTDVYSDIKKLERQVKKLERQVKELEQASGITIKELRSKKKLSKKQN